MMGDESKIPLDRETDGRPVPQLVNNSSCQKPHNLFRAARNARAGLFIVNATSSGKNVLSFPPAAADRRFHNGQSAVDHQKDSGQILRVSSLRKFVTWRSVSNVSAFLATRVA